MYIRINWFIERNGQTGKTDRQTEKGACEILHDMCAGSWIKTKGACRYSDGSFNAFASSKATTPDACKEFCVKNSKCDAFDTNGDECVLFQHQDGKTHTGNGEGDDFCYIQGLSQGGVLVFCSSFVIFVSL